MAPASCEIILMNFIKHKCNRYIYPSRLWKQVLWHWKTVSNPELLGFGQTEVEKADRGWSVTDKRQKTATNHQCTRNWRNFAKNLFFGRKMDNCALEWKGKYKETKAISFFVDNFQFMRSLESLSWKAKIYDLDLTNILKTKTPVKEIIMGVDS